MSTWIIFRSLGASSFTVNAGSTASTTCLLTKVTTDCAQRTAQPLVPDTSQSTTTPERRLHVPSDKRVELKGGMYAFMSLRIGVADVDTVDECLADKVQQAPGFFANTPIVVDLTPLDEDPERAVRVANQAMTTPPRRPMLPAQQ